MSEATIISVIALVTIVVKAIIDQLNRKADFKREQRNREWDIADRAAKAEGLKHLVRQQGSETKELIADNTTITQQSAEQLGIVQERQDSMQGVVEQTAMDILHHSGQPVFDDLIDKYKPDTQTDQELTQFIERLEVIVSDPNNTTAQVPAARLMLQSAKERQAARNSEKIVPASEHKENALAGEQMRKEAEPQQGQSADDGEGSQGTAKKVAALSDKIDRLAPDAKVETLKKTIDRIDQTTTDIKADIKAAIETAADAPDKE